MIFSFPGFELLDLSRVVGDERVDAGPDGAGVGHLFKPPSATILAGPSPVPTVSKTRLAILPEIAPSA